jgi:glycosyltransferase involved in cell wall biosynthesis
MDPSTGLAACTVVSKNHLAYARVVCESFRRHHPGARFFAALVDRNQGEVSADREDFTLVELEALPVPELPRVCFQYNILELNCAAKPFALRHVLQQPGISRVLYLDSDTFVYRELTEALELLERHSIVLTPHLVAPAPDDGRKPGERHILESGTYNAGFLALRNDATVGRFLQWWSERVFDKCIADPSLGLFVDQRWLDLVPGLFDGVHVLRSAAYNLGHWGLPHRRLEPRQQGLHVDGVPLALFHFSGLDVANPEAISGHQDRFTLQDRPALRPLFEEYVARVKAAGHQECGQWPYAFARFGNGVLIPPDARRLYWGLGDGARRFGDPFQTRGTGSFWHWLQEEAHAGSGISRLWHYVHGKRPDLVRAFPDLFGRDRQAYLSWIITAGRWQQGVPEALAPAGPALAPLLPVGRPRGAGGGVLPGVNVTGHAHSEKGVGEVVRAMVRGLSAAGVPHCVVDYADGLSANRDRTLVGLLQQNPYPVNLIHVNAIGMPWFVQTRDPRFFRGKYNIGYWLWELPELPPAFHGSFSYLDEVWVSSDYCLDAIARVSPIPVVKVPPPLPPEGLRTKGVAREYFGLQDEQRVFLFLFDAQSIVERKNPRGLIRTFKRAFPDAPDARLVLKLVHATPALVDELREEAADPRVLVIDQVFDREEVLSLIALSDCYVSLHRSEGFGLTLAEAMALGKPVIATAYSANMDFMNVGNSLLVRYDLVRLEHDFPPYPKGSAWADPDLEHAAELMRLVYDDPARARELGQRARHDVMGYLSPQAVGARIAQRLALVGRDLEAPGSIVFGGEG